MLNKRGQTTIFIIVGILITVSIVLILYLQSLTISEESKVDVAKAQQSALFGKEVVNYVESCLRDTVKEAIFENGRSGGYFLVPEHSTTDLDENVPYYLYEGQLMFPFDQIVANEIADYTDTMLSLCLDNFAPFKGYNITHQEPTSRGTLKPDTIRLRTDFPIEIKRDKQTKQFSDFYVEVPAEQFYNDLVLAKEITTSIEKKGICLTCFSDIAEKEDVFVAILPLNNNTYLFDLKDRNYLPNYQVFHLRFGVKYVEE